MKVYFNIVILSLLLIGLMASCSKDTDTEIGVIDEIPEPEKKIFSTIHGLILNTDNELIEGAEIRLGDDSVMSDENGFFKVSGFFNENGTHILVKKPGYFNANGLVLPSVDAAIKVNVILEDDGSTTNFSSTDGAEVQIEESSIVFATNGFQDLNGNPYTGTVTVKTKYTDPSEDDFSKKYPGYMLSKESGDRGILPFSIVTVDLYDDLGNLIQINQEAEVTMKVPDDLLSVAPSTVPLWYLDAESGLWIQDGEASLDGNHYKGKVSHFTDWMCGLEGELFTISGAVTKDGLVYPDADMGIIYDNGFSWRYSFRSDDQGRFARIVIVYELNLIDSYKIDVRSQCGKVLFEESNIQLTESEINLDIDVIGSESFKVEGSIFCGDIDNKVSDGYVLLEFDDNSFSDVIAADSGGNFEFFYEDCGLKKATLRGYNPAEQSKSPAIPIVGNTVLSINACEEEITSSVIFEIDGGEDYVISNCTVTVIDTTLFDGAVEFFAYEFTFTDFFTSYPDATDEYIEYKLTVNVDKEIPGKPLPPLGPILELINQSENPPRSWIFVPYPYEIVSETDDLVVMNILLDGFFPAEYDEGSSRTEVMGVVRIEATKN